MNAEQLKLWRSMLGLTQEEAAKAFGMSHRQYQEMEHGRVSISKRTELSCGATAAGIFKYEPTKEEKNA